MAQDRNGKDVVGGARVYVECDVAEVHGEVLHLKTVVPTAAYPKGTSINVLAGQVEILEREDETEKLPLSGNGASVDQDKDATKEQDKAAKEEKAEKKRK